VRDAPLYFLTSRFELENARLGGAPSSARSALEVSSMCRVQCFILTATVSLPVLAACGGPATGSIPNTAPARESGQSALMGTTFAGQHKCNASSHDRPFIIEWDATDASSFQARAANDVVFVKYEGCNLTVIDSCNDDSVRGAYGAYKLVEWTSGAVEKVDIDNVLDLYAKLPLGVALLGGRVQAGEKFHMEYFVSGTRSATRPAIYKADIAKNPGCNGATHFVYGYNLGAFALGSRSKIEGAAGVTVWGAGAGGSSKHASAIEKHGGELGACRSDSAKEVDQCKVPIRLTLREITDGESPTAQAAKAPETPEALNLASRLQATTDAERKAGEHYMAAQTKLNAGDGRGCLAELDEHDRLDSRAAGLSTKPGAAGTMRALCLMQAGQCDAGKQLARKSYEAMGTVGADQIDRMIDGQTATYCKDPKNDRDRFLRSLQVLARQERVTAAECQKAYDTAKRLVSSIKPRDNYDPAYDAPRRIADSAPACFARAGDCKAAWSAAREQSDALDEQRGQTPDDARRRRLMVSATGERCVEKDQGPLSDAETLARSIVELDSVRRTQPPSTAFCTSRVEKARPAVQRVAARTPDEGKRRARELADKAASCLATADDCKTAWRTYADLSRSFADANVKEFERSTRNGFRERAGECAFKPQGVTAPNETILWAAGVLEDGARSKVEPRVCQSAYETAKRAAPQWSGDRKINSEWHYGTRDIPRYVGRCLQRAVDCKAAWTTYKDAYPVFGMYPNKDEAGVRAMFEGDVSECKGGR
jgi:hypothetical protein